MKIKGWSEPSATSCSDLDPMWEDYVPDFQLVRPVAKNPKKPKGEKVSQLTFDFFNDSIHHNPPAEMMSTADIRKQALGQFRNSLPERVVKAVEKFGVRQWQMLVMFYYDPATIELAEANPVLTFFLAQYLDCDAKRIQELKCGVMPRKEILKLLGYPATNSAVKVLNKVNPRIFKADNWKSIDQMLIKELGSEKTQLNHLPSINYGVLEILSDDVASPAAGAKLLEEVAKDHREKFRGRVIHMIRSSIEMQQDLQVDKPVVHFPSMKRLYDIHDSASSRYRRRINQLNSVKVAAALGKQFSSPPFPGLPGKIEPITTPNELVDEGEKQCNCVASYARNVAAGNVYIYKIIEPQRATLSILKKEDKWVIGELEAKYNKKVSLETESMVSEWLANHRLKQCFQ